MENLPSLKLELTPAQVKAIDQALELDGCDPFVKVEDYQQLINELLDNWLGRD